MIADLAGIKSFKKRPFVLTYHNEIGKEDILGNIVSQIYNVTLGNFLLTRANLIIATTQSYAKDSMQLRKHLQKVRIIPNGVDVEIFNSRLDGHEIREKYDLDETAKIILFVGRLDHYKGCHYLINAFSRVLNDIPEARLILVGKGPLEMELRSQIRKKGLTSKIILAGYVRDKDLPNYYGASDLFVLPSISFHEGFGLVQLEAMACGKPVITTTLSGVAEVDSEGTCSIHVPPKDEISLAEAIKHLLKKCRVMEDMAKNARKKAINYSWENVVKKLEVTYKDINS
jgi:glycosyltransferase involved in cell wall biosynthesis